MQIKQAAAAGTLESSDVFVEMRPSPQPLSIELNSPVKAQFGEQILASVNEVLAEQGVREGHVHLEDHGALDCTIRARVLACLARANGAGPTDAVPAGEDR